MQKHLLILGFGYTAFYLSKALDCKQFRITGTSRKADSAGVYTRPEYELIPFDEKAINSVLSKTTHLLISTPPSELAGDPAFHLLQQGLANYAGQIEWLGYLSTTGVYGDHQGRWVHEDSDLIEPGARGLLRIAAEHTWRAFSKKHHLPLHIFRLAAIYGPERNGLCRIKKGKTSSIYKPDHLFSRIHVEDLAEVLIQSMAKPSPFAVYNVADDCPAPSHEVDLYAARLLNLPAPELLPIEEAEASPMLKEFYQYSKKISNEKIKNELAVKLKYPDYKTGLDALFRKGEGLC